MFNEYPYTNLQDVNLDWILKHIKDLEINLQDFVKLNTIKYADPIIWNITKQYETNTVVIDGNTGTAYLSVQPVPAGVALTNDDYWTVIFTLNLTTSNQNITFRDDGTNVLATFESDTGDWILWNFYLYKVTQPISVNTAYVEGFNIERFSVELFIREYINTLTAIIGDINDLTTSDKTSIVNAINSLLDDLSTIIGSLDDLTTTDKDSIVDAINELVNSVSTVNDNIGDLEDLHTTDKDTIVDAINETFDKLILNYVTPEYYGAVGDGVTDDTAALQAAINTGAVKLKNGAVYLITAGLLLPDNIVIDGNNATIKIKDNTYITYTEGADDPTGLLYGKNNKNVKIFNLTINTNASNMAVYSAFNLVANVALNLLSPENVSVEKCTFDDLYTEDIVLYHGSGIVNISDCVFKNTIANQGLRGEFIHISSYVTNSGAINISNNDFINSVPNEDFGVCAIYMANMFYPPIKISNNHIVGCGRNQTHGHNLQPITFYKDVRNAEVSNNDVNSVYGFIRLEKSEFIRVHDNRFVDTGTGDMPEPACRMLNYAESAEYTPEMRYIWIYNNTFSAVNRSVKAALFAIYTIGDVKLINDIYFENNVVYSNGIDIFRVDEGVRKLKILNNDLTAANGALVLMGQRWATSNNNLIANNDIEVAGNKIVASDYGVRFMPTVKGDDISIHDNIVQCALNGYCGFRVDNFVRVSVHDNMMDNAVIEMTNSTLVYASDNVFKNMGSLPGGAILYGVYTSKVNNYNESTLLS